MTGLDNIIKEAEKAALVDGYDRVIFMTKKKGIRVSTLAGSPNIKFENVIGYIRLFYKDRELFTRYSKGGYVFIPKEKNQKSTYKRNDEIEYRPRMEIRSGNYTCEFWYEWGSYETEQDALMIAKKVQKEIENGKWEERKELCKNGDVLKMSVEKLYRKRNKSTEIIEL